MRSINVIRKDIALAREMLADLELEYKEACIAIASHEEHEQLRSSFMDQMSQLDIDNITAEDFTEALVQYVDIYGKVEYLKPHELKAIWSEVEMCIAYP